MCRQVMGQNLIHKLMSMLTGEQREQLRESLTILYKGALEELGIEGEAPLPGDEG
jgi:hypothetical protein